MRNSRPRILFYSHDTYGLGHLRRCLAVAGQLAGDISHVHQLLLTGSLVAGAFGLPPRTDMVKLPALSKRSNGAYKPRALPLSLRQTLAWREQMILQTATAFKPDLLIVDKSPAGVHGELLPTLRYLKTWSPQTRLVLGMRDIEDNPATTRAEWRASGARRLHENVYDAILLYGATEVFDPVREYGMSAAAAAKLIQCGYLGRAEVSRSAASVRRELDVGDRPLVVVTVGGGGDGYVITRTFLDMLAQWPDGAPFYSLIVSGPLMAQRERRQLRESVGKADVTFLEFTPYLTSYLAAADLVVSMAGYNTTCELLWLGKRSLLIPRVRPRSEQHIRAQRLAERGLARTLAPDHLTPEQLQAAVQALLTAPTPAAAGVDLNGLRRTSQAIAALLNGRHPPSNQNSGDAAPKTVHVEAASQ